MVHALAAKWPLQLITSRKCNPSNSPKITRFGFYHPTRIPKPGKWEIFNRDLGNSRIQTFRPSDSHQLAWAMACNLCISLENPVFDWTSCHLPPEDFQGGAPANDSSQEQNLFLNINYLRSGYNFIWLLDIINYMLILTLVFYKSSMFCFCRRLVNT